MRIHFDNLPDFLTMLVEAPPNVEKVVRCSGTYYHNPPWNSNFYALYIHICYVRRIEGQDVVISADIHVGDQSYGECYPSNALQSYADHVTELGDRARAVRAAVAAAVEKLGGAIKSGCYCDLVNRPVSIFPNR